MDTDLPVGQVRAEGDTAQSKDKGIAHQHLTDTQVEHRTLDVELRTVIGPWRCLTGSCDLDQYPSRPDDEPTAAGRYHFLDAARDGEWKKVLIRRASWVHWPIKGMGSSGDCGGPWQPNGLPTVT